MSGLAVGLILGGLIFMNNGMGRRVDDSRAAPAAGKPFPEFSLSELDGEIVSLDQFKGQPVVLNFWATWCEPCKAEMPLLQSAIVQNPGLVVLGINYDEGPTAVRNFLVSNDVSLPVLLDPGGRIAGQVQVFGFPTTFFIDAEGILQATHIGQLDESLLQSYLAKIGY